MKISIIIPVKNEEKIIEHQLKYILNCISEDVEIIVVDGGSTDKTLEIAKKYPVLSFISPKTGRASQMNYGARQAKGSILYFVHIDSTPPKSFVQDILASIKAGYPMGTYRQKFDSNHLLLKINAFFTRFDFDWCRGGDQSFFIKKSLFFEMHGYNEDYVIMEEYEFLNRVRKQNRLKIIPKYVITSARKYDLNSYWKVMLANFEAFKSFRKGTKSEEIAKNYKKKLNF